MRRNLCQLYRITGVHLPLGTLRCLLDRLMYRPDNITKCFLLIPTLREHTFTLRLLRRGTFLGSHLGCYTPRPPGDDMLTTRGPTTK